MFFGYTFGPVVRFFHRRGGQHVWRCPHRLWPLAQWSVGNGLIGLIAGLACSSRRKKSLNTVLYISAGLTVLALVIYLLNWNLPNLTFFEPEDNIFGDATITTLAGISLLIGFILVLAVRFGFAKDYQHGRGRLLGHVRQPGRHRVCRYLRHLGQRLRPADGHCG